MICHLKTTISWYIVLSIIIAFLQTKASCVFKNNFNKGAELCHLNIQSHATYYDFAHWFFIPYW